MKLKICAYILPLLTVLLLATTCDFDTGLGLMESEISGDVIFINSNAKADYVDAVRVVAVVNFPPEGLGDVIFSNSVDISKNRAYYSIPAPIAEYTAIGAIWKRKGREWNYSNILGLYGMDWANPFDVKMEPVKLTKQNPVADSIDIQADWSRTALDGIINGTVTFVGEWPENTEYLGIFVFSQIPDLQNYLSLLLTLKGYDIAVPKFKQQYNYSLPVYSGEIKWIGIAFKSSAISFEDTKILGFYRSPNDPSKPGAIIVEREGVVDDINFTCDFGALPEGLNPGGS